jgi:hypothetical protein
MIITLFFCKICEHLLTSTINDYKIIVQLNMRFMFSILELRGKRVKGPHGPATVFGELVLDYPLASSREGRNKAMNHKSGDLHRIVCFRRRTE